MKKNKKNMVLNFFIILAICLIIYLMKDVLKYYKDRYKFDKINSQVEEKVKTNNKDAIKEVQRDFKDVVAYISIKDLNIEYPIAQAQDNEYYLRRDLHGNYSEVGTIFIDHKNKKDFSDSNTIIYGHNMQENYPGGDAFGKLDHYLDPNFNNKADKIIEIITEDNIFTYKIISIYSANKDYNYREINPEKNKEYIESMINNSLVNFNVDKNKITEEDKIITLSTCVNSLNPNRRFVVQAIKIKY